jgi:hypothetical protein
VSGSGGDSPGRLGEWAAPQGVALSPALPFGRLRPADATAAAAHWGLLSAGRAFLAWDREVDKAAIGPVWLPHARGTRVVADALLYGESGRHFDPLRAWVIRPNHVHVRRRPKTSLAVITSCLQGSTARQAKPILGRTGEAFRQDELFDDGVRDEVELDRMVRYVEYNPVGAGLAANPRA